MTLREQEKEAAWERYTQEIEAALVRYEQKIERGEVVK